MQLELLNEQGQASSKVRRASKPCSRRDYSEDLVHQVVRRLQANARQARAQNRDSPSLTKKPFRQGHGRARAGMTSSPLWRGAVASFEQPRRELLAEGQQEDVPRRHG